MVFREEDVVTRNVFRRPLKTPRSHLPFAFTRSLLLVSVVFLVSRQVTAAQSSASQNVLTNQAVVELVRAKIGENVILDMIKTMPTRFTLTPDAIIQLKRQGVSDKVLQAMVARAASAAPSTATPPATAVERQPLSAAERLATSEAVGTWKPRDQKDPMTGRDVYDAQLVAKDDRREQVVVRATCSSDNGRNNPFSAVTGTRLSPTESMNFEIHYLSRAGQQLARTATPVTGEVDSAPEIFGNKIGTDAVQVRGGESCVYVRMRVGDMLYGHVAGGACGNDNVLRIAFNSSRPNAGEMLPNFTNSHPDNPGVDAFGNSLMSLIGKYADAEVISHQGYDATLKDLLNADTVLVELPLNDGTTSVVSLATTEPPFRQFAARCAADFERVAPGGGYLGVSVHTLTPELARQSGVAAERGALVEAVDPAGPAARSGLRAGDVVTALDAQLVDTSEGLTAAIRSRKPGSMVHLGVLHDGRPIQIAVTLGDRAEMASSAPQSQPPQRAGLSALGPANPMDATSRIGRPFYPALLNGTKEAIAADLPASVERAAAMSGLNPHDFDKEIALILDTVNVCAQITPQMAATVAQGDRTEDVARLGDQYKRCQTGVSSSDVRTWNRDTERGLVASIRPEGPLPKWQYGYGFLVTITIVGDKSPDLPIVYARVTRPQ